MLSESQFHRCSNYQELSALLRSLEDHHGGIFVLLTAGQDEEGYCWSEISEEAVPKVKEMAAKLMSDDQILIQCCAGNKEQWDEEIVGAREANPFLISKKLRLSEKPSLQPIHLPIILQYRTHHRKVGMEVMDDAQLDIFFNECW